MRLTPPKAITPTTMARAAPVAITGMPKASCTEVATEYDCSALKPNPKVTSSSAENSTASHFQCAPRPRSM